MRGSIVLNVCSFVPESVLKKRKATEQLKKKALAQRAVEKKAAKEKRCVTSCDGRHKLFSGRYAAAHCDGSPIPGAPSHWIPEHEDATMLRTANIYWLASNKLSRYLVSL